MEKIKKRILQADFRKIARRFVIIAVIFLILSIVAGAVTLRTQISDVHGLLSSPPESSMRYDGHETEWEDILRSGITPLSAAAGITIAVTGFLWLLLIAVYWLLTAAWLYQAADRAKMKRALWLLLGLAANAAAVVLFLLMRSILRTQCPSCGSRQKKTEFCTECGAALMKECPSCHNLAARSDAYCASCGEKLGEEKGM